MPSTTGHGPGRRRSLTAWIATISVLALAVSLLAVPPDRLQSALRRHDGRCAEIDRGVRLAVNIYDDTQLRYVVHRAAPHLEPGDIFVLVSGNNGTAVNISWLDRSAALLKREFHRNTILAYTAGLKNVATIARRASGSISGVVYGYEPGMSNEPEFSWRLSTGIRNMATAYASVHRYGKRLAAAPTGRPLLESDLLRYSWNYKRLSRLVGTTIVQTQTWAKEGLHALDRAVRVLRREYGHTSKSWMPQLTIDSTDGNGISPRAAYIDTKAMEAERLRYVSIWWSDQTSYFGKFLGLLRARKATSPRGRSASSSCGRAHSVT